MQGVGTVELLERDQKGVRKRSSENRKERQVEYKRLCRPMSDGGNG